MIKIKDETILRDFYNYIVLQRKDMLKTPRIEQRLHLLAEKLQAARGGELTSSFHTVVVCEQVDEWAVGYGNEGGGMHPPLVYLFRKEKSGEERAHAYAFILCSYLGYKTYIVRQFTNEAYVFLVRKLDAYTGEVREAYLDDWR